MPVEITQEYVDQKFTETKKEWDKLWSNAAMNPTIFAFTEKGMEFLGEFQKIREQVIDLGFFIPELCENVRVKVDKK